MEAVVRHHGGDLVGDDNREPVVPPAASRELLPVVVLGAAERNMLPAVSLLLPVRRIDGVDRVGVLHKSVKDWLTDARRAGRFAVAAAPALLFFA